jgi:hypothetical protein
MIEDRAHSAPIWLENSKEKVDGGHPIHGRRGGHPLGASCRMAGGRRSPGPQYLTGPDIPSGASML